MIEKYVNRLDFESYEDFHKNFKIKIPKNFNFAYDIVDEWAKTQPNKKALVHIDNDGKRTDYTFEEISKLSNKAVSVFKKYGIEKGDFVMLMLKQRMEVWVCMLALHKIGAVVIPATFQLTEKDIIYRINSTKAKMIVAAYDGVILSHIDGSKKSCPSLNYIAVVGDDVPSKYVDFRKDLAEAVETKGRIKNENSDNMLMYFSSGTTGMPKMVMHDYTYPLGHIVTAYFWHRVKEDTLHFTSSDSGWAKFAWGKIYGQWICGATIVAYDTEKFVPQKMLEDLQELKPETFCAPPTVYRFLIKEDIKKYDLSSIHSYSIAGEPLNPEVLLRLEEFTGKQIKEGFGQSESAIIIGYFRDYYPVKPGSMGKPNPIYDVDIVDENGNSCEDGVEGTVVIKNFLDKPAGLFREYYNDEQATSRAMIGDAYSTGDVAWRDSEGYYWFVGRNDDVIKCSGYRIGPFEVESALLTHPAVIECAVTAVPDPVRGQVVKATIVLTKGYTASDELKKELQDHVKRITAPYKYPRVVEFVDELPKTISGKIKRKEIRKNDHISG